MQKVNDAAAIFSADQPRHRPVAHPEERHPPHEPDEIGIMLFDRFRRAEPAERIPERENAFRGKLQRLRGIVKLGFAGEEEGWELLAEVYEIYVVSCLAQRFVQDTGELRDAAAKGIGGTEEDDSPDGATFASPGNTTHPGSSPGKSRV